MSAPLGPLLVLWIAGLLVGERAPIAWPGWLLWGLVALHLGYRAAQHRPARDLLITHPPVYGTLLALAFVGGATRAAAHRPLFAATDLATYNDGGRVTLRGTVVRYPEARGTYTRYEVAASELEGAGGLRLPVRGRFLVNLAPYPAFAYGDELRLSGELVTPPVLEDFDYRAFLAHKGIFSLLQGAYAERIAAGRGAPLFQALFALRQRAERVVQRLLPEPHASLLNGILLGIESGIPEEVMDAFNATGTTHIIVISGSNFAVLAAFFLLGGRRLLGERRGTLLAIGGMALYALFVGGDPPVLRAALMGSFSLVALLMGRQALALNLLALALLLMTLAQPGQLYDVGFQLSALATLGLIVLVPPLTGLTARLIARLGLSPASQARLLPWLGDALLITLAAQLITLPLIVGTFGRLSLVSLGINLLILPAQGFLLLSGALATAAGLLWLPLGQWLAALPFAALAWTVAVVRWGAALPFASVTLGTLPPALIWLGYGIGGVLGWRWQWRGHWPASPRPLPRARPLDRRRWLGWGGLLLAALLPWWVASQRPDGRLHLYALAVGQGDALLIVTPSGQQILVDGGPDPVPLLTRLGERLPPWDRTLELLVLTHPDADHLGGLPVLLDRYHAAAILDNGAAHESALYQAWQGALVARHLAPRAAVAGQQWQTSDGVTLEVLAPRGPPFAQSNDNSVVLRLRYGHFCALLPGDVEAPAEARLVASGTLGPCAVLKAPHHGSATSSTPALLDALAPSLILVSVGAANRFGHPAPPVLARYATRGATVLRTDRQGTLHLATDGRQLWVQVDGR